MKPFHDDPLCACRSSTGGIATMCMHCLRVNQFLYPCGGVEGECSCERCQVRVAEDIERHKAALKEQRALLRRMKAEASA